MYWRYRNGIVDITPGELRSLARYEGVAVDLKELEQAKKLLKENIQRTKANRVVQE